MSSEGLPPSESPPRRAKLEWIRDSGDVEQLEGRYDEWAETYDADLVDAMHYRSHELAVDALVEVTDKDDTVLDGGCGTGLVGLALARRGYVDIVGLDLSAGMLAQAERTGAYRKLVHSSFADFSDGDERFDAAISVGVFTQGHAPARALDELAACVRSGGCLVIGIRTDAIESMGYAQRIDRLVANGTWAVLARTEPTVALHEEGKDVLHEHWTFHLS